MPKKKMTGEHSDAAIRETALPLFEKWKEHNAIPDSIAAKVLERFCDWIKELSTLRLLRIQKMLLPDLFDVLDEFHAQEITSIEDARILEIASPLFKRWRDQREKELSDPEAKRLLEDFTTWIKSGDEKRLSLIQTMSPDELSGILANLYEHMGKPSSSKYGGASGYAGAVERALGARKGVPTK